MALAAEAARINRWAATIEREYRRGIRLEPTGQARGCCGDPGACGNSVPVIFKTESQAFIRARVAKGTIVHADEAASWNGHERVEIKRINHPQAYSLDGACADMAEEHVDLRRAAIGLHHHIAGAGVLRSTQGCARRDDNPHLSDGDTVNPIAAQPHPAERRSPPAEYAVRSGGE